MLLDASTHLGSLLCAWKYYVARFTATWGPGRGKALLNAFTRQV